MDKSYSYPFLRAHTHTHTHTHTPLDGNGFRVDGRWWGAGRFTTTSGPEILRLHNAGKPLRIAVIVRLIPVLFVSQSAAKIVLEGKQHPAEVGRYIQV